MKTRTKKIDLNARKTEEEHFQWSVGFIEDATTTWFNWIRWVFALGIVSYIADATNNNALLFIEAVSYVLLMSYFLIFFLSFDIKQIDEWVAKQPTKLRSLLAKLPSIILMIVFTYGSHVVIRETVEQIKLLQS